VVAVLKLDRISSISFFGYALGA